MTKNSNNKKKMMMMMMIKMKMIVMFFSRVTDGLLKVDKIMIVSK